MVESEHDDLSADPSQGSHFFHNLTTLGISYLTVRAAQGDRLDRDWLSSLEPVDQGDHVAHVRLDAPMVLKVDGRHSLGVICTA